jgi:hypothetical protein
MGLVVISAIHGQAASGIAQQAKGPATSAYEGNVGDWALGRWEGAIFPNYVATGLSSEPRIMIIQRLADGKVGCRWATPASLGQTGWAPRCHIKPASISLTTTADSEVELDKAGNELEGRMLSKTSTRYRAHLKRVQ